MNFSNKKNTSKRLDKRNKKRPTTQFTIFVSDFIFSFILNKYLLLKIRNDLSAGVYLWTMDGAEIDNKFLSIQIVAVQ